MRLLLWLLVLVIVKMGLRNPSHPPRHSSFLSLSVLLLSLFPVLPLPPVLLLLLVLITFFCFFCVSITLLITPKPTQPGDFRHASPVYCVPAIDPPNFIMINVVTNSSMAPCSEASAVANANTIVTTATTPFSRHSCGNPRPESCGPRKSAAVA